MYFPVESTRMKMFFRFSFGLDFQSIHYLNENNIYLEKDKCLTTVLKFVFRCLSDVLFKFHGNNSYGSLGIVFGAD